MDETRTIAIIVEGMDHSGKSTLIKNLDNYLRDYPGKLGIKSQRPKDFLQFRHRLLTNFLANCSSPISIHLYDRFSLISEPVYSRALERISVLTPKEINHGWEIMRSLYDKLVIIHCVNRDRELGEKPEMGGVIEKEEEIRNQYILYFQRIMRGPRIPLIPYNYQTHSFSELISRIRTIVGEL